MVFRVDRIVNLAQLAQRVDEEGFAFGPAQQGSTVLADDGFLGVCKQQDVQPMLVDEFAMASHVIPADPHGQGIEGGVLFEAFSKSLHLGRSARRPVLRIKKQQHPLPPELGERTAVSVLVGQGEVRSGLVDDQ